MINAFLIYYQKLGCIIANDAENSLRSTRLPATEIIGFAYDLILENRRINLSTKRTAQIWPINLRF